MIDFARISVKAGNGGDGAGSFRHIKGKRRGKADGGSGGDGGNVYIEASRDLNTLEPYRFVKDYFAKDGRRGFSNLQKGARGGDLVLRVPVGTVVKVQSAKFKVQSEEPKFSKDKLSTSGIDFDLASEGDKILVARGGQGGRGNAYLRDEYGRRPFAPQKGELGELANLTLELKLIADVGLIGLPNAGKSMLLTALTAAKPQIADYPFTTLEPNLGVLSVNQWVSKSVSPKVSESENQKSEKLNHRNTDSPRHRHTESLVLADIPGLIEGASRGRGLGDLFLRHIERTKILVHLIDISSDSDKWQEYQTIRNELKAYSPALSKKLEIIALSKIDLVDRKRPEQVLKFFKAKKKRVVAISAKSGQGLRDLVRQLAKIFNPRG